MDKETANASFEVDKFMLSNLRINWRIWFERENLIQNRRAESSVSCIIGVACNISVVSKIGKCRY